MTVSHMVLLHGRMLEDGELELFKWTAEHYVGLAREYRGAS